MLTTRKIGKFYYVRGTVRVGKDTIKVPERSTGFVKAKDAASYVSKLEAEIRDSILNPTQDKSNKTLFSDCVVHYLNKRRPKLGEMCKINILLSSFENVKISQIWEKWNEYIADKKHLAIPTLNRYAATINAIINACTEDMQISYKPIKMMPCKKTVVFMLNDDIREKLLSCYSKHARPIFTVLAYQGFREQECLQLLWEDINFKERVIVIRTSKNGETRSVPMHKKTWWVLARLWFKEKCPISGHVWLNNKRKPYTDTRKGIGGSPIRKAHTLALARLKKEYGIDLKMRIHDFRHNFASQLVMHGVDLITIQKLGGWKSIDMVKRYATFSNKHEIDSINKI